MVKLEPLLVRSAKGTRLFIILIALNQVVYLPALVFFLLDILDSRVNTWHTLRFSIESLTSAALMSTVFVKSIVRWQRVFSYGFIVAGTCAPLSTSFDFSLMILAISLLCHLPFVIAGFILRTSSTAPQAKYRLPFFAKSPALAVPSDTSVTKPPKFVQRTTVYPNTFPPPALMSYPSFTPTPGSSSMLPADPTSQARP